MARQNLSGCLVSGNRRGSANEIPLRLLQTTADRGFGIGDPVQVRRLEILDDKPRALGVGQVIQPGGGVLVAMKAVGSARGTLIANSGPGG